MENCPIDKVGFENFEAIVQMVGGKWKLRLLFTLATNGKMRYGEIKKSISAISHKMLSSQLKELESDGLIKRRDFKEIPPKVEYALSQKGEGLKPIMEQLCVWIEENTTRV